MTPVREFSLSGSISPMACPSHPSVAMVSGSHVCQMYVLRKCDRLESGYPTPCTTAILPASYISLSGTACGLNARVSSIGSTSSWEKARPGRAS